MPKTAESLPFLALNQSTELSGSERRFATLYDLSPNVVLLTRLEDGLICEANRYFESSLGWPIKSVLGRTTVDIGLWTEPAQRVQILRMIEGEP
ncbi:hypothetical protein QN416_24690, partial [Glaciimonas sp. Cout2]